MNEFPILKNNNKKRLEKDKQKTKLLKQNTYDLGNWTKVWMMKDNIMTHRQTIDQNL